MREIGGDGRTTSVGRGAEVKSMLGLDVVEGGRRTPEQKAVASESRRVLDGRSEEESRGLVAQERGGVPESGINAEIATQSENVFVAHRGVTVENGRSAMSLIGADLHTDSVPVRPSHKIHPVFFSLSLHPFLIVFRSVRIPREVLACSWSLAQRSQVGLLQQLVLSRGCFDF